MPHKNRRPTRTRLPSWPVLAALATALLGFLALRATRTTVSWPFADLALRAARRMELAEQVLKEALLAEGLAIETELDPNGTGLIGPDWTPLTTTLGSLEAKRTSLDPNFAALMVRYFHDAGLEEGDVVAVGASGSFPGLAIATLCAARELGLKALTIASFGSSMYGATRPGFTIPRMIRILSAASILPDSLIAVSPGGEGDNGESFLFEDARSIRDRLAREAGVEYILFDPPDLEASIARRLRLYEAAAGGRAVACFVNIGGASPNSGATSRTLDFPQGLVLDPPPAPASADRGLMYEYSSRGIPVINLLNIRLLAQRSGLAYDPVPLPRPGQGGVYQDVRYDPRVAILTLCVSIGLLVVGSLRGKRRR